ncbi:hypothetical protein FisN_24Hu070 [Fistulifera solaris]|uniref:BTB domain-containing protein n=1 Tax=Fistulifera solaris TaxID=1519565 RepID=A0A1Z5JER0_FISSO|nr:hypothetical protein FisN_24Hu070 [Fistulifera solaris]|eukprot:GAX12495.1 hypothetical protein FisN_24Hu070 [Fistulifera solaris]
MQDDQPKWRDDPVDLFSDWKIEIISFNDEGVETTDTYHVHKNFLAHGSRRSKYFFRLFRSEESFTENQASTSRIDLDPLAAQAFPVLLDFVYGSNLSITSQTATALHHLGEYFEIRPLQDTSFEFCQHDMSLDNLHAYYASAKQLHDDNVMNLIVDYLRLKISKLSPTNPIVLQSSPDLWLRVLGLDDRREKIEFKDTILLSQIIAKMCMSQSEAPMDAKTFYTFTNLLTSIHSNAALDLCELDDRYSLGDDDDESDLSALQQLCVDALSANWTDRNKWNDEQFDKMKYRKPKFIVKVLRQTVSDATSKLPRKSHYADY